MPVKRLAVRKLSSWLVPACLAPALGMTALLALRVIFGQGSAVGLVVTLPVGLAVAFGLSVSLLACDVLFVGLGLRVPPTGLRAWLAAAAAPVPFAVMWHLLHRPLWSSLGSHALSVALALIVAAALTRLLFSPKLSAGFRFGQ